MHWSESRALGVCGSSTHTLILCKRGLAFSMWHTAAAGVALRHVQEPSYGMSFAGVCMAVVIAVSRMG